MKILIKKEFFELDELWNFNFWYKIYEILDLNWNDKTGLTIQIQNPILILDCQSQSNPPNWIAIRIEQSSNPIQQYPASMYSIYETWPNVMKLLYLKRRKGFISCNHWHIVNTVQCWKAIIISRHLFEIIKNLSHEPLLTDNKRVL